MGIGLRALFRGLRLIGLFPAARALTRAGLRQAIRDAAFDVVEERVFGTNPNGPYIVARKPGAAAALPLRS